MNEIEKAITYFEALLERLGNGDSDNAVCATALAALRGQAEREKGCVWCKSDNKVTHNGEHFCFFCSYCGKRLEVEP